MRRREGSCGSAVTSARRPALVLALALLAGARPATATIRYEVSVERRDAGQFQVTMSVPEVRGELLVQIPAWNALYQIRDFAAHVVDVRAVAESPASAAGPAEELLPVLKLDNQTWRIEGHGTIILHYEAIWDEPGPFSSQLNPHHAFLNLADVLMYSPARRWDDVAVSFTGLPPDWGIAVELKPGTTPKSFVAANYDALVDAPVEMSAFQEFRVEARGAHIRVVVDGAGWDQKALAEAISRIASYQIGLMGEAPFDEFLILYHIGDWGAGGMEHANSTAIATQETSQLPAVTAHEFFHLWNVKRIRPQSLEPVEYTREMDTRALWFAEGVTSTYAAYTMLRAGLWSKKTFYEDLSRQITMLQSRPAHAWQSVEQSSLDTWFDKYPLYRRPEVSISYYNKGQILGLLLDILIRDASENRASLDDLMRYLNKNFAHRGRFYRDTGDIRTAAEQLAGRSLGDFFDRYVSGTDEIPYDDILGRAGWELKREGQMRTDWGFQPQHAPDGSTSVAGLESGSPAERAGLRVDDVLVGLNGDSFPRHPYRWLAEHQPGETVELRVRRPSGELSVSFALGRREEQGHEIQEARDPTEKQRRIREGLLRGATDSAER